jgi:poly(3-hydroxybutyrate) depolymerase
MKRQSLMFLAVIALFSASGFAQTESFMVAGVSRNYIKYVPAGISNPPLVFNIHGYNMDAASERGMCQMDKIADRDKFIIVYPNAINKSWDLSGPNDFAFILAIIDTIDARHHIDRNRIYAAGFSQGGFMSFALACKYADIFTAIGPVSGLQSGACTPTRPVPVMLIFGTDDVATTSSFMSSVKTWLTINKCPTTPVVTQPYPSTNSKSLVTQLYYGPCDQGTEVIADSVLTGQHQWPMNTSDRINASEEIWTFFKKFSMKSAAVIPRKTSTVMRDYITVSCSSGKIRLLGIDEQCRVRVMDAQGRVVADAATARNTFAFNNMPAGLYMVMLNTKSGPITLRMVVP